MRILTPLRREEGFTLIEIAIAGLLSSVVLGLVAGLLALTYRTSHFTQGQSFTLDDARTSLQQVARDIQNASHIDWCGTAGACLELVTWSPTEELRLVRYSVDMPTLEKAEFDADANSWADPRPVLDRLANPPGQPVFTCDLQTALLRINVDFVIQPTPDYAATYHLHTSVRPRNYPSSAICP